MCIYCSRKVIGDTEGEGSLVGGRERYRRTGDSEEEEACVFGSDVIWDILYTDT